MRRAAAALMAVGLMLAAALASAADSPATSRSASDPPDELNGFAVAPASVDPAEILAGGPPRDGIPALDDPATLTAAEAPWDDDEHVIGVSLEGEARAYPLAILVWHELVNDTLGGQPILVSYCPLCGTGMVFDRNVGGRVRRFGVSGLIYRSDLLLFDRETESLWSQIAARAVTGPARGTRLRPLRARVTSWGAWKAAHPATRVLSPETGHRRRYGDQPYGDYALGEELLFPVPLDERYHPKMPTAGLRLADGTARAYPAAELLRAGGRVRERFAGHEVSVAFDAEQGLFRIEAPPEVEVIEGYWFAWAAFHPDTEVYRAAPATSDRPE